MENRAPIARKVHNVTFLEIRGKVMLFSLITESIKLRLKKEAVSR